MTFFLMLSASSIGDINLFIQLSSWNKVLEAAEADFSSSLLKSSINVGETEEKERGYLQWIKTTKKTAWICGTFNIPFNRRKNQSNTLLLRPEWDPEGAPWQRTISLPLKNVTQGTRDSSVHILY
jgi:hypothetical protein